jgi:ubiquinone/menaquinone biosynthesis C-methylase UbiE
LSGDAETSVSSYYNTSGWRTNDGITEDARRCEDLREAAKEYVSKCRLRVLTYIPDSGENILDMASGPIQYDEYFEYSKHFKKRYCIDLSQQALDQAKSKIGDHGVYICGSFLSIPLETDFFDCTISLHTIYHIDKNIQEDAVRKLIEVTKPGKNIIIVYSNPHSIIQFFLVPILIIKKILLQWDKEEKTNTKESEIYFFAHPINWWSRFQDSASVKIVPWRSLPSEIQKRIIPNNKMGKKIFEILFKMEERYPDFFVHFFQYPMIILTKRDSKFI